MEHGEISLDLYRQAHIQYTDTLDIHRTTHECCCYERVTHIRGICTLVTEHTYLLVEDVSVSR